SFHRLLFDGVAEMCHGLADLPAGLAESFLDRTLGALKTTLALHLLVAGENPDGLFDLPLGLLHFSLNFLLFHGVFLSAKACERAGAFSESYDGAAHRGQKRDLGYYLRLLFQ